MSIFCIFRACIPPQIKRRMKISVSKNPHLFPTFVFIRYVKTKNSVVLDYAVEIIPLEGADRILSYGELGNFSVAGFEMVLQRHISHYLITYYLPSGRILVPNNGGGEFYFHYHQFLALELVRRIGRRMTSPPLQ